MLREPGLTKNTKRAEHAPVRILLLEDDPLFADLLQTQLRRLPWAESRLELQATSRIEGDVHARRLHLEEGAILNGTVNMGDRRGSPHDGNGDEAGVGASDAARA